MDMRGMLRNLGAKGAGPARAPGVGKPVTGIDDGQRLAMLDAFEEEDIGWFWATDPDNRLIYLSPSAARRFPEERQILGESLATVVETIGGEGEERTERPLSFQLGARNRFADLAVRVGTLEGDMFWSLTGKPHYDAAGEFQVTAAGARHHLDLRAAARRFAAGAI